jgi:hypothetical protein
MIFIGSREVSRTKAEWGPVKPRARSVLGINPFRRYDDAGCVQCEKYQRKVRRLFIEEIFEGDSIETNEADYSKWIEAIATNVFEYLERPDSVSREER